MATPYDPNFDPVLEERRRRGRAEIEELARRQQQGPQSEWDILLRPFTPDYGDLANAPSPQAPAPQMPTPGVPTGMTPPRPAGPSQRVIPQAPNAIGRDAELDSLYENYKQKIDRDERAAHPDLGFAWGGGTPQAYRPGDDIRSGAYGAAPTEGAGIRAGTTDIRTGGFAPQASAGTFSQSDIEKIPIGQRPHSWFQDQQMETDLERQYADRARSRALAEDPFGLQRYNYQFEARGQRDQELMAQKRQIMAELEASIEAAINDPRLHESRRAAKIEEMRQAAFAELEALDPRSDFKPYMGAF